MQCAGKGETCLERRCAHVALISLAWVAGVEKRRRTQGPEEMCVSLEHQNPSKTSEKMGYFDRVTVSLHIL